MINIEQDTQGITLGNSHHEYGYYYEYSLDAGLNLLW